MTRTLDQMAVDLLLKGDQAGRGVRAPKVADEAKAWELQRETIHGSVLFRLKRKGEG